MEKSTGYFVIFLMVLWIVLMDWAVLAPESFKDTFFRPGNLSEIRNVSDIIEEVEPELEIEEEPEIIVEEEPEVVEEVNETEENETVEEVEEEPEVNETDEEDEREKKRVKVASWYIDDFGNEQSSNDTLMNEYADVVDGYDFIFIQGIQDESGEAFLELCELLPDHLCRNSTRGGDDEQYGLIYDEDVGELDKWKDFNDENNDWKYPPLRVFLEIDDVDLIVYSLRTDEDEVQRELKELEEFIDDEHEDEEDEKNIIVIGNLNADCDFYNSEVEGEFNSWDWAIEDKEDTTVDEDDCAYDRIIMSNEVYTGFKDDGIKEVDESLSKHHLVWVDFEV